MLKKENIQLQRIVLSVGILLLTAKFVAFILTNSNAIFTDAVESIVNVVAAIIGLYSMMLALKPKDDDHPYGHGKVEYISASLEGGLIVSAGIGIIIKSIYSFFIPHEIKQLDFGIILIVFTGIINYIIGFLIEHKGKKNNSLILVSGGKHLQTDAYSTAGILIGLGIVYLTDWVWLDALIAIVFGFIIIYTGFKILKQSVSGIMDAADKTLLNDIMQTIEKERSQNVIDIHNMRLIKYGATWHIDCHITVPYYFTVEQAHKEIDAIDQLINNKLNNQVEFFIHTDACIDTSCTICPKTDCTVRKTPYEGTTSWTLEAVLRNRKHRKETDETKTD